MYDALLEALKAGNTAIPCSEFQLRFDDLCQVDPAKGKSKLQEQFEVRFHYLEPKSYHHIKDWLSSMSAHVQRNSPIC